MNTDHNLPNKARELREWARRARRLAGTLSQEKDQAELRVYAEELEKQAAELEAQGSSASAPPQQVTQEQQQAQQQQASGEPPPDPEKRQRD
jgi:hypothetical protein